MALNINADQAAQEAQGHDQPKDNTMNNQNTGFGAPPQNQGDQYNPNEQHQNNNPHHNPDMMGHSQETVGGPNHPGGNGMGGNGQAQPEQQQQSSGGGFAHTFNGPSNGGGHQPQNNGHAMNQTQNYGGPTQQNPTQQQSGGVPANLMKTGAEAMQAFQNAQQSQGGGDRRFFLKQGEERTVVFMDGDLDENGFFRNPVTREHTVKMGNKFQNILCLNEQEPCPLCALAGENSPVSRAAFVCYFTVLDRTGYMDQQGQRHADFTAIYVAKTNTLKQLQAFASKLGGLRGQEFTITRTQSNNAPRVGDMFIPGQKYDVQQQIIPYFVQQGRKPEDFQPFDYAKALTYYSADELRSMGFNDGHFSGSPTGFHNQGNPHQNANPNPNGGNMNGGQNGGFQNGNQGNGFPQNNGFGNNNAGVNAGFGNQGGGLGVGNSNNPGPTPTNQDYSQDM